jgi:Family of unknown function (DUF6427)
VLQLFRSNQIYILPLLLLVTLLFRAVGFLNIPETPINHSGILSDVVYTFVGSVGLLPQILALVLVFIQAWLTNAIVNEYQLLPESTWYPAVFFLILSSFSPEMQTLSPILMGNTFFMIALIETFRSYKNLQTADTIFNIGFWIAVASMFYASYWVFLIWGLLGITLLRNFKLEETLILIIGFFVPYFLLCVYFFWTNGLGLFLKTEVWGHFGFFNFNLALTWQHLVVVIVWAISLASAILNASSFYDKTSIQAQRSIQLLFWAMGLVVVSLFTQAKIDINHLLLFLVPLSVFTASTFLQVRKTMYAEFAFIVFVFVMLVFQYQEPILTILDK